MGEALARAFSIGREQDHRACGTRSDHETSIIDLREQAEERAELRVITVGRCNRDRVDDGRR